MIEIEYKFQLDDITMTNTQLKSRGAVLAKPRTYELSVMYDNPQQLMQKTDSRIRVRQSGDTIEFCYKKPITRKGIKKEIEHQVEVNELDSLVAILASMEFTPTTSYERYRTEYTFNNVKITIDEYPFANFVEIEGAEDDIISTAGRLGFDINENLTDSCDSLFIKWRRDKNLPFTQHMKFKGYDK